MHVRTALVVEARVATWNVAHAANGEGDEHRRVVGVGVQALDRELLLRVVLRGVQLEVAAAAFILDIPGTV